MSNHTKGPWHFGAFLITAKPGQVVAGCREHPIKVEDGHLIAAAPDLLEAAKEAEEFLGGEIFIHGIEEHEAEPIRKKLAAAIAKAEALSE